MHKISFFDELQMNVKASPHFSVELESRGLELPLEENIIFRAAQKLRHEIGRNFEFQVRLKKNIPTQAGLGGGSSNAAAVIQFLGEYFRVSTLRQHRLAAQLGSDVNFFLTQGNSAWCTGRGETCSELPSAKFHVLIVIPKVGISTGWAYQNLDRRRSHSNIRDAWKLRKSVPMWLQQSFQSTQESLIPDLENDFESLALDRFSELRRLKNDLVQSGASCGQMSGSGSCFFGIYPNQAAVLAAAQDLKKKGWKVMVTSSLTQKKVR